MEFPEKMKTRVPIRSSNLTPGHISGEKTAIRKDKFTPMFIVALFTISRTWKQHKFYRQMNGKEDVVYVYNGTLLSHKKEIMPLGVTRVNLETIILSDVSHKEKRQVPCDISYIWNLKYNTNEHICKAEKVSQM